MRRPQLWASHEVPLAAVPLVCTVAPVWLAGMPPCRQSWLHRRALLPHTLRCPALPGPCSSGHTLALGHRRSPEVNAFVVPGGKVVVYTGRLWGRVEVSHTQRGCMLQLGMKRCSVRCSRGCSSVAQVLQGDTRAHMPGQAPKQPGTPRQTCVHLSSPGGEFLTRHFKLSRAQGCCA